MESTGFVYLLSNPAMPGMVKIGQTTRAVEARVAELSAHTGVPAPFVIEATFASQNPVADEARVHARLAHCRIPHREFFLVELVQALEVVTEICGGLPHYCSLALYAQTQAAQAAQQAQVAERQRIQEAQAAEQQRVEQQRAEVARAREELLRSMQALEWLMRCYAAQAAHRGH
jgi:hypothetical protein